MRGIIGVVSLLALSVTVAVAQPPRARTASLLPPRPLSPDDVQPVARGVSDEIPLFPGSTPVTRPTPPQTSGPAWLNGGDPNVRPASGTMGSKQPVRPLTPPDASLGSRGLDKLRGAFTDVPSKGNPKPGTQPPGAEQANASTPFRGTGPNGAPVLAGPPAWRWNGYGAPTPGANPLAPSGQYSGASANWYAITGATPGAFPTPVMNPLRTPPGTEPPAYATTPGSRSAPGIAYTPQPSLAFPEPPRVAPPASPPPDIRPTPPPPAPVPPPPAFTPPSMSVLPLAPAMPEAPVAPVTIPTITPPPLPVVPLSSVEPEPRSREPDAVGPRLAVVPPTFPMPAIPAVPRPAELPSLPTVPVMPEPAPAETPKPAVPGLPALPEAKAPASPAALPSSVTDEQLKWQPKSATPIPGASTTPHPATIPAPPPNWQQSRGTGETQPVARGQVGENRPDAVAILIRKLCDRRAEGVEVRWTGSKRVTVCFECRTAADAQQLVKDISARPELAPLQIDFCVLVK